MHVSDSMQQCSGWHQRCHADDTSMPILPSSCSHGLAWQEFHKTQTLSIGGERQMWKQVIWSSGHADDLQRPAADICWTVAVASITFSLPVYSASFVVLCSRQRSPTDSLAACLYNCAGEIVIGLVFDWSWLQHTVGDLFVIKANRGKPYPIHKLPNKHLHYCW